MRYVKTINLWKLTTEQIAKLQCGQWVSAGSVEMGANVCGRFYGAKKSGSVVVAWQGNALRAENYKEYQKTQYNYAKS